MVGQAGSEAHAETQRSRFLTGRSLAIGIDLDDPLPTARKTDGRMSCNFVGSGEKVLSLDPRLSRPAASHYSRGWTKAVSI